MSIKIEVESEEIPIVKKVKEQHEPVFQVTSKVIDFIPFTTNSKSKSNRRPVTKDRLPIMNYTATIVDMLQLNQVLIITGGTGCGKSTQVPQMILKHIGAVNLQSKKVRILCTQPRRIAAKSLAARVAQEMDCELGDKVGYQVGMDAVQSRSTQILFVTTGIFLQKLIHDREKVFQDFTHIIMDEVHERDIDIDFGLIILKNLLKQYPQMRLILMSATIASSKFSNYFSKQSITLVDNDNYIEQISTLYRENKTVVKAEEWLEQEDNAQNQEWGRAWREMEQRMQQSEESKNIERQNFQMREDGVQFLCQDDIPAPIIAIQQSQKYAIDVFYMETIHQFFNQYDTAKEKEFDPLRFQEPLFFQENPKIHQDQVNALLQILAFIDSTRIRQNMRDKNHASNGSVLIFCPGYQEIMDVREAIVQQFGDTRFDIIVLHSTIAVAKDFDQQSTVKRRLIISTNIAESSITVPDCLFVCDFCMTKEIIYNARNLTEKLALQYCSRASCDQRKGRTGRLFPGFCFRLIPESIFTTKMSNYIQCEMLRCPLEKIILRLKKIHSIEAHVSDQKMEEEEQVYLESIKNMFSKVERILKTALDPPDSEAIQAALENLKKLGALTWDEKISQLGCFMCDMPIDIFLTRFIIIALGFGCGVHALSVAAILSQKKSFFIHQFNRKHDNFINTLYLFDQGLEDDVMIQLRIYILWEKTFFGEFNTYDHGIKRALKSFTQKNVSPKEIIFTDLRQIDAKNMREILNLKFELLSRMETEITKQSEILDLYADDTVQRIKTAFAAAYLGKCIQVMRDDSVFAEKKSKYVRDQGGKSDRSLIFDGEGIKFDGVAPQNREFIKQKITVLIEQFCQFNSKSNCEIRLKLQEKDIEDFLMANHQLHKFYTKSESELLAKIKENSLGTRHYVKSLQIQNGQILVMFNAEVDIKDLQFVIKKLQYNLQTILHIYEIYRREWQRKQSILLQANKQMKISEMNWEAFCKGDHMDIISMVKTLNCTLYYHPVGRLVHLSYQKELGMEIDSINHVAIQNGSSTEISKCLVAYELQEKDQRRNLARTSVKIHDHHYFQGFTMWGQIIALLFGVQVQLLHDQVKSHFLKARIDNRDMPFDHFLTESDLCKINDIRTSIKQFLQAPKIVFDQTLWNQIQSLNVPKVKILFNSQEVWMALFQVEFASEIRNLSKECPENQLKRRRINQNRVKLPIDVGDTFMLPIEVIRTDYESDVPKQFDAEGIRIYAQINQLYQIWKQNQIQMIQKQNFFIRIGTATQLVCTHCTAFVSFASASQLVPIQDDNELSYLLKDKSNEFQWMERMLAVVRLSPFGDCFNICKDSSLIKQFMNEMLVQQIFIKLSLIQDSDLYTFISCSNNQHIIGFYLKKSKQEISQVTEVEKVYVIDKRLTLVFTSMRTELFLIRKFPKHVIENEEKLEIQKRKLSNQLFHCKACYSDSEQGYFSGTEQQYAVHIRTEKHKKNFELLVFATQQ